MPYVKYISIKKRKNHLCYLGSSGKELTQTCQLLIYINDLEVFIKYSVFTNHWLFYKCLLLERIFYRIFGSLKRIQTRSILCPWFMCPWNLCLFSSFLIQTLFSFIPSNFLLKKLNHFCWNSCKVWILLFAFLACLSLFHSSVFCKNWWLDLKVCQIQVWLGRVAGWGGARLLHRGRCVLWSGGI